MKTSNKPLTAFEVYDKGKVPEVSGKPPTVSRKKIKKLKRRTLMETKMFKVVLSTAEDFDPKSTSIAVIRKGAVKKKKTLPTDNENDSTNKMESKKKDTKVTERLKEKKGKKLNKEKNSIVKKPNSVKNEKQADFKKKIAEGNIVDIRSGAVKPVKKKKTLPTENKIDGLNGTKKKPKKKIALPPDNENDSTNKMESKKKDTKVTKRLKEKKLNKEKSSIVKKPKSVKNEKQADFEKKITEGKKLVKKKAVESEDHSLENDEDQSLEGDEEYEDTLVETNEWENKEDEMECVIETFTGEELNALNCGDSRKVAQETFRWIIKPNSEKDFFEKFWETAPLLVKRNQKDYYKGLFSTQDFDKILHEQVVWYSKNLDITSYSDGKRDTHNPIGQAHPPVVWDYYNNGCSIRLLNPQTFHPRVWKCLASLQEYFNSFCGANVYLTPPDTQGFAPHWDDIEAFILQLEGKKRWKVYAPRSDGEVLPDYSSPNLTDGIIGKPILDTILEPGDLLYFPRGYIHQGHAVENEHSLHITISSFQKNTWGHYLEKLLPQALSLAMSDDVEFRKGLPRQYLDYMGIVHKERDSEERDGFKKKVRDLVMRMMENAPFDACVDQRGSSFIHDCLPPYLTAEDRQCSAYGGGERWCSKKKRVIGRVELQPDTLIRLIRGNCIRLVAGADKVHIYHCLENSREYHKKEPQFLEIATENAPAVNTLIRTYSSYVAIESLPLQNEEEKMAIASGLWERGLLVSAHPFDAPHED